MSNELEDIFAKLGAIYKKLSASFPKLSYNPCQACNEDIVCCRADVIFSHVVSGMELVYLQKLYPDKDIDAFRDFIKRKKDSEGNLVHIHCPFYSKNENGCAVYNGRPLSCRLFGPYFLEKTEVPVYCGFKDIGKVFKRGELYQTIPGAKEFVDIKTLFYSRFHETSGVQTIEESKEEHEQIELSCMESGDPFILGKLLHNKGRYEEALIEYIKAQDEHSNSPAYYLHLACLYQDMGKDDEALASYNKVLEFDPENPYVPFKIGILHELAGRTGEAIISYRRAISLNPSNAIAHGSLGFLLLEQKEIPLALEHLTKATSLDPSNGFYFFGLGLVFAASDKLEEAKEALIKSVNLNPLKEGYLLLASVMERLGDDKSALLFREKAQQIKD